MEKRTVANTPNVTPNKEEPKNCKEVSTKYTGLYAEFLKNGDISFVGRWRCPRSKTKAVRLGRKSKGMTPMFAYALRLTMIDQEKKEFIKTLKDIQEPTEAPPPKQILSQISTLYQMYLGSI